MTATRLKPDDLYTSCLPDAIPYELTSDAVATRTVVPGQQRALEAIEFGIGMHRDNYNLYVAGSNGLGKHALVNRLLKQLAAGQEAPPDWCYVNNPEGFYAPNALKLPAGTGPQLRQDMSRLINDLTIAVPAAFESDEYRSRVQQIEDHSEEKKECTLGELADRALGQGVLLTRTDSGYTLSPTNSDQPMEADEFRRLRQVEQDRIEALIDELKQELKAVLLKIPAWAKEGMVKLRELNRSLADSTVDQYFPELLKKYTALPEVTAYLQISRIFCRMNQLTQAARSANSLFRLNCSDSKSMCWWTIASCREPLSFTRTTRPTTIWLEELNILRSMEP